MTTDVDVLVRFLEDRGARTIEHPGGTLGEHVRRTHEALIHWGARPALAIAGLCHACYGTDGFAQSLVALSQRDELAALIGDDAEAIVHVYASCDRDDFYPQLGRARTPAFRDRFSGRVFALAPSMLRDFVELTFANELDLVQISPAFAAEHGPDLAELFARCEALVSAPAAAASRALLARVV
jgi:hypothetical protein